MTEQVAVNDRRTPYTATASQTVFDIDFPLDDADYIVVYQNAEPLDPGDYTVDTDELTVTLDTGADAGDSIVIEGLRTIKRVTGYPLRGGLSTPLLNFDMNTIIQILQETRRDLDRSISLSKAEAFDTTNFLPLLDEGKTLKWGAAGIENGPAAVDVDIVADLADEIATLAGIAADVTTVADNNANVTTVAGISTAVSTVGAISASVTTVAGISASITTVAGISGSITTVAGISSSVTTVAGISSAISNLSSISTAISNVNTIRTDVSAVSAIAANVTTVAGIAANITTVAGISAAVSTVSGISGNVSTVAGISGNVTTVAGISASVTTVAGLSSAITNLSSISTAISNVNTIRTDVSAVSAIAANVTTVAGMAANIASVVANMTTITDAANNIPKANRGATTAPGVGDDSADGYSEGSLWVNTSTDTAYLCMDPALGAAVWQQVTTAGTTFGGLTDVNFTALGNLDFVRYDSGSSKWINRTPANVRTDLGLVIGTNVQAYDAELAALAGLTSAADKGIQFTGSGTAATYDLTAFAKTILDDADAAAVKTTLGLVIGTNVQAYDAELAAFAGLTSAADKIGYFNGAGTMTTTDFTATARSLLDDTSISAMLTTLGVGLADVRSFTGQQTAAAASITSSSAHIAWNLNTAQSAKHTFTENTTLDNPTNMVAGGTYVLVLTQHASSPKTLAFGNAYKWPSGAAPVISNTNGAIDILTFISDGTSMYGVCQKAFA